ncbi:MAG: hypothetical protein A2268_01110 [Candidatus Raymondbacteria bacterium RifOxyA12_full_50_37]|uniref:Cytochrome c-552/4 domain-containing protein n=1 Tax=Candidatus Raymondbacteria bacterium RIFOXYD12_FULL_49_13 TaxID=1817890 RepID=A0A1F7FGC9_UNCRA|nr:MAG: hypothetical protein A2268_01110 [Candidatus Raymondbacteria bacterium RifOxyA12_full_50_37]OGJ86402.1 MAG: hypothetical protein A2248_14075 [Candidatus Raymondbacteria bacterium RIFOXYA2_FULL_49_16]OGJ95519.1 MAG: hypothetical protein A2350_11025 [Candidatus Raymondbacteria bacterium RifOxyB12_full_50_8]OGJ95572.1 MAG: hypothetical protein A2453_12850 [Candidatus Raymondbacteria bacterium RIFOXYC2_FULL_50_21]OGK05532.1 MAG: hypothetical protein A2519_05435 [Candidatus Raymondbacteria b
MLDAGNYCSTKGREQKVLSEYFMRAMKPLNYSAVLVSTNEMALGLDFLLETNKKACLPLVSSNITDQLGKPVFTDLLQVGYKGLKVSILGLSDRIQLTDADKGKVRIADPGETAEKVLKRITKTPKTLIILLSDLNEPVLNTILQKHSVIDLVICADLRSFSSDGRLVNKSFVVSDTRETRNIQGLNFSITNSGMAGPKTFSQQLGPEYEKKNSIDKIMEGYKTGLKDAKLRWPRPADAQPIYAGPEACIQCHRTIVESWRSSRHAHAIESLEKNNDQYNPLCLECHVTGYEKENGFWDIESSRDMAGVQCEQCHGPQAQHIKEENDVASRGLEFSGMGGGQPVQKRFKPQKARYYICTRCHSGDWQLKVSPEEAWKMHGHSK